MDKKRRNDIFTIVNEDGDEMVCQVLFTFASKENDKNYMVYTDNTKDDKGNIQVYASTYDPNGEDPSLKAIETEKEWKIIETILDAIQKAKKEEKED